MNYVHCMKTVIGGLSLVLVLSACSSGSKSQKTAAASSPSTTTASSPQAKASAAPPVDMPRSDVVSDRGTTRGPSYSPIDYPSDQPGSLIVPPKSQRPAHPGLMPKARWYSTIQPARIVIAARWVTSLKRISPDWQPLAHRSSMPPARLSTLIQPARIALVVR